MRLLLAFGPQVRLDAAGLSEAAIRQDAQRWLAEVRQRLGELKRGYRGSD